MLELKKMNKRKDYRISKKSVEGLDEEGLFWTVIEPIWPDESVKNGLEHIAM